MYVVANNSLARCQAATHAPLVAGRSSLFIFGRAQGMRGLAQVKVACSKVVGSLQDSWLVRRRRAQNQ